MSGVWLRECFREVIGWHQNIGTAFHNGDEKFRNINVSSIDCCSNVTRDKCLLASLKNKKIFTKHLIISFKIIYTWVIFGRLTYENPKEFKVNKRNSEYGLKSIPLYQLY